MKTVTRNKSKVVLCALLWLVFSLPGCTSALPRYSSENSLQETTPFLPPTAQSVLPSLTAGTAEPTITPAVICKDQLTFLSDLTIPDGEEVSPNSTLDKRWEVENSGNCNWDENYRIRLIAGPDLKCTKRAGTLPSPKRNPCNNTPHIQGASKSQVLTGAPGRPSIRAASRLEILSLSTYSLNKLSRLRPISTGFTGSVYHLLLHGVQASKPIRRRNQFR